MDEIAKTKYRNRISALAYLLLAILGGLFTASAILDAQFNPILMIIIESLIGTAGIILLVLKKRDLSAIVFLMFATLFAYYTITGGVRFSPVTSVLCWLFILFPLIILTTREKKATTYFCVFLPYGIGAIVYGYFNGVTVINVIMHIIFTLIALMTAILYVNEKLQKPFALKLRSDEDVQFTRSGPGLGYYLLAVFCIIAAVAILMDLFISDIFYTTSITCGISLIIVSCLLAIFARQQISSLLVLLAGLGILFIPFENILFDDGGAIFCTITGILFIIFTVISIILKKRILIAVMFILIGLFFLITGIGIVLPILNSVLFGLAGIIGIYLTFTVMKKKALPIV